MGKGAGDNPEKVLGQNGQQNPSSTCVVQAHLNSCLGMLAGCIPLLLAQLQQLLQLLLHVAVCLAQLGHPLKLPHLRHPAAPRGQGQAEELLDAAADFCLAQLDHLLELTISHGNAGLRRWEDFQPSGTMRDTETASCHACNIEHGIRNRHTKAKSQQLRGGRHLQRSHRCLQLSERSQQQILAQPQSQSQNWSMTSYHLT